MERLFYKNYHSEGERYLPDKYLAPMITQCPYCKNHLATADNMASRNFNDDMMLKYRFCLKCGSSIIEIIWDFLENLKHIMVK